MNKITRTITTTTVHVKLVSMQDGQVVTADMPDLEFAQKLTHEKAKKAASKAYGKGDYLVEMVTKEKIYAMDVEQFMECAEYLGDKF